MSSFANRLDAAAGATTCNVLATGGSALVGFGAVSLVTGGGVVPLALGSAALLAANYGCNWDPSGTPTWDSNTTIDGCSEIAGGYGWLQASTLTTGYEWVDVPTGSYQNADQTIKLLRADYILQENGKYTEEIEYLTTSGLRLYRQFDVLDYQIINAKWRIRPITGTCDKTETPGPLVPDYDYTDPDSGCEITVNFQGLTLDGAQNVRPVYKMSPKASARAGGGVIGGCNFEPIIYVGGPNGPAPPGGPGGPTWGPWQPDWDGDGGGGVPPWVPAVTDLVAPFVPYIIDKVLEPFLEVKYPPGARGIYAACNYKQDGTPETFSVTFPEENYQNRVLTSLNAIVDFQQQILLWRTPTCSGGGQSAVGEPVTINWISDEFSGASGDRIRKLFTYFDQVGSTLEQTVAHWRDFSWQAGPVIVSCVGTPLGKPQVWAESLDEAKRVIGHAAAIAGVDLTDAEWLTAPPKSTRYGNRGTMRVHRSRDGLLGITKRDGPSGPPMALP